ncbi:hypothetical protein FGO68_gene6016 [Halteria grandinella]|uniref:Uncharacterized protein n=1 Tax=Halteria grandinella TaxID=5974 RepID=A0A8J8NDD5_HALGN|nr:hypothetical protein FGO68_gene6016 [Halteria grandinella]
MFRNPISHQQYSPPGLPTYTPIGSHSPNLNLPIGNLGYSFEQQSPDIKNAKAMDRQAIIEERRKERIKNALMQQLGTGVRYNPLHTYSIHKRYKQWLKPGQEVMHRLNQLFSS